MRPRRGLEVRWLDYLGLPAASAIHAGGKRALAAPGARFALRFLAWFVAIEAVVAFLMRDLRPLQDATAAAVVWSSAWLGLAAQASGPVVAFGPASAYEIDAACTGVSVAILLVAAVAAYPSSAGSRSLGALLAVPFVFLVNLARLDAMGWLLVHAPAWFDFVHEVAWQGGVILLGAFGFLLWARFVAQREEGASGSLVSSVALFLLFLVGLGGLAFATRADAGLRKLLFALATPVGHALWGASFPPAGMEEGLDAKPVLAVLVGFVALFLATPRVPARRRLLGALVGGGVPAIVGGVVSVLLFAGEALRRVPPSFLFTTLDALAYLGLPLAAWLAWLAREKSAPRPGGRRIEGDEERRGGSELPSGRPRPRTRPRGADRTRP